MRYRSRLGHFKADESNVILERRVEDEKEVHIFTPKEHLHLKETKDGCIEIVKKEKIEDWNERQKEENYRAYDQ